MQITTRKLSSTAKQVVLDDKDAGCTHNHMSDSEKDTESKEPSSAIAHLETQE